MSYIHEIALASMFQDMQRLENIAHNMANVTVPGFQRGIAVGKQMISGVRFNEQLFDEHAQVNDRSRVILDIRPGSVRATGRELDLALTSPGYFEIETPDGLAYTRRGEFQLDAQGRLATLNGFPVMGSAGYIVLTSTHPRIDGQGRVFQQDTVSGSERQVGQLRLIRFDDFQSFKRGVDGLLILTDQQAIEKTSVIGSSQGDVLQQGHLENANTQNATEMIQLMQTMRHFESMQKMVLGYDEMLGVAVRKLGELT